MPHSGIHTMIIPMVWRTASADPVGNFQTLRMTNTESAFFQFRVPNDFTSLVSAKIGIVPDATETIQYDLETNYAAVGESYDTNTESLSDETLAVTELVMNEIDASGVMTGIAAGDYVALEIASDTTYIRIIMLTIEYE